MTASLSTEFTTRASSINRALDLIGDKWCLLILQEVFWGINSFNEMMAAMGVSRGVLSNRLNWLQEVGCLRKETAGRPRYHLTTRSMELYDSAIMAVAWERRWYRNPQLDRVELVHTTCGHPFTAQMRCRSCDALVKPDDVSYTPGPGATLDLREKKVRRRSSVSIAQVPSQRALYLNLINIVGDRWTSNLIALSYHGLKRFEQFSSRTAGGNQYTVRPTPVPCRRGYADPGGLPTAGRVRYEYHLTEKGKDLYPWFLSLLQWGDKWCDPRGRGKPMQLTHLSCGDPLVGEVRCSACGQVLRAHDVRFSLNGVSIDPAIV